MTGFDSKRLKELTKVRQALYNETEKDRSARWNVGSTEDRIFDHHPALPCSGANLLDDALRPPVSPKTNDDVKESGHSGKHGSPSRSCGRQGHSFESHRSTIAYPHQINVSQTPTSHNSPNSHKKIMSDYATKLRTPDMLASSVERQPMMVTQESSLISRHSSSSCDMSAPSRVYSRNMSPQCSSGAPSGDVRLEALTDKMSYLLHLGQLVGIDPHQCVEVEVASTTESAFSSISSEETAPFEDALQDHHLDSYSTSQEDRDISLQKNSLPVSMVSRMFLWAIAALLLNNAAKELCRLPRLDEAHPPDVYKREMYFWSVKHYETHVDRLMVFLSADKPYTNQTRFHQRDGRHRRRRNNSEPRTNIAFRDQAHHIPRLKQTKLSFNDTASSRSDPNDDLVAVSFSGLPSPTPRQREDLTGRMKSKTSKTPPSSWGIESSCSLTASSPHYMYTAVDNEMAMCCSAFPVDGNQSGEHELIQNPLAVTSVDGNQVLLPGPQLLKKGNFVVRILEDIKTIRDIFCAQVLDNPLLRQLRRLFSGHVSWEHVAAGMILPALYLLLPQPYEFN